MNILVLNGSPKGESSITYHHLLFLEKHFKSINFKTLHIGQKYKKLSNNDYVEDIIHQMTYADIVIWAYPVYTFSVPYQLMSFVNKLFDHPLAYKLQGLHTCQFSTSKHFYDITAYDYLHHCLEDLGMKHLKGHMADMNDLLEDQGRKQMIQFFDQLLNQYDKGIVHKKYRKITPVTYDFSYTPCVEEDKPDKGLLLVYNGESYSDTLKHMIRAFENKSPFTVHLLDLSNVNIKGGCLGCIKCSFTGHCVYKDEYEKMHREKVQNADVIIYASDIKNHWFDDSIKCYHDRAFFNGHRVSTIGKTVGYLLVGDLKQEHNLRTVIESRASVSHMNLLEPVVSDDPNIEGHLDDMIEEMTYILERSVEANQNFYGVGGMKIFRDLVYTYRSVMIKEHDFYKAEGLYDFPKHHYILNFFGNKFMNFMSHPKRFSKISNRMNETIIGRYKKQLDKY